MISCLQSSGNVRKTFTNFHNTAKERQYVFNRMAMDLNTNSVWPVYFLHFFLCCKIHFNISSSWTEINWLVWLACTGISKKGASAQRGLVSWPKQNNPIVYSNKTTPMKKTTSLEIVTNRKVPVFISCEKRNARFCSHSSI